MNLRNNTTKYTTVKGETNISLSSYCRSCQHSQSYTDEARKRKSIKDKTQYNLVTKFDPVMMEKRRQIRRDYDQRARERKQQEWEESKTNMPVLKYFPSSTSKLARNVYKQVFNALASYNIRFKAKFNYLLHRLYQKAPDSAECGLRADLLVEVNRRGKKPLIMVIEVQG